MEKIDHHDVSEREIVGTESEIEFQKTWKCACGGKFIQNYSGKQIGNPDFKCEKCGKLVEVKYAPNAFEKMFFNCSQIPYDNYSDDVIFALNTEDGWKGIKKQDTMTMGPYPPAHYSKPTWYYKVLPKEKNFILLILLGLRLIEKLECGTFSIGYACRKVDE